MLDWRTEPLKGVAEIRLSNVDKKSNLGEQPVRLCNYVDVYSCEYVTEDIKFMEATATAAEVQRFCIERGDVLITKDSETPDDIGIPAAVIEQIPNLVCGYHVALIKPKRDEIDPIYLAKQLETVDTARYFGRLANGSTRYSLSSLSIANTPIRLAPLPQQQRIAEILTTVDEAIEHTEALIAKTQQIKASLMHDLFTRGVTPDGRLRPPREDAPQLYKESPLGWIPKEWAILPLNKLADIRPSNVDKKSNLGEQPVRLCNYMDVYSCEYVTEDIEFMEATATAAEVQRFCIERGDVLITKDSETPDDIGIPAAVIEQIPNLVCGYHVALIKPKRDEVDPIYLAKQLETVDTARYFGRLANGSTRYSLSSLSIANTPIRLAPLPQQQRIAKILTTVDEAIEHTEALITKKQQIKAGLMHDLLTGRIRVMADAWPEPTEVTANV